MFRRSSIFLLVTSAIVYLVLAGCAKSPTTNGSTTTREAPTSAEPSEGKNNANQPTESQTDEGLSWDEAADNVGERTTVTGPVVSTVYATTSKGEPTFLNVGKDYPDPARFTVVIWGKSRDNFGSAPEDEYDGKTISVTGQVVEYNGIPEIEVTTPDQIKVK